MVTQLIPFLAGFTTKAIDDRPDFTLLTFLFYLPFAYFWPELVFGIITGNLIAGKLDRWWHITAAVPLAISMFFLHNWFLALSYAAAAFLDEKLPFQRKILPAVALISMPIDGIDDFVAILLFDTGYFIASFVIPQDTLPVR